MQIPVSLSLLRIDLCIGAAPLHFGSSEAWTLIVKNFGKLIIDAPLFEYNEVKFNQIHFEANTTNPDYNSLLSVKNISNKSKNRKIDPIITRRIWKAMIKAFIDYEFRKFKKKK